MEQIPVLIEYYLILKNNKIKRIIITMESEEKIIKETEELCDTIKLLTKCYLNCQILKSG